MLLGVLGCSLGDYEQRIDQQRKRIEIYDEENRVLFSDAVRAPGEAQQPYTWPFDVYLRLPTKYGASIAGFYKSDTTPTVPLFRYNGGEGYQIFVAAGWIELAKEEKDKEKEKDARGKDKKAKETKKEVKNWEPEWTVDAFRAGVLNALLVVYHFQEYKSTIGGVDKTGFGRMTKVPLSDRGESLPAIAFEAVTVKTDTSLFAINFHENGTRQVAVIFQYPHSREGAAEINQAIDWSLKSLDISHPGAANKRKALKERKR